MNTRARAYCSPYKGMRIESWCKLFNELEVHVSEQLTQSASPPCVNFSETFTSLSIKSYLKHYKDNFRCP